MSEIKEKKNFVYTTASKKRITYLMINGMIESKREYVKDQYHQNGVVKFTFDDFDKSVSILNNVDNDVEFNRLWDIMVDRDNKIWETKREARESNSKNNSEG